MRSVTARCGFRAVDRMHTVLAELPGRVVVRRQNRREVQNWLAGPIRMAAQTSNAGDSGEK
ncbi:MAG: hypothetical protein ACRDRR_15110 [Pseudonocardiaceae bacterium]